MIKHFGLNIREKPDGLKLARENYIKINRKSSFSKEIFYSDVFIEKQIENSLFNYDLNMNYFHSLSKLEFNEELIKFLNNAKFFVECSDLSALDEISGYYIMVLGEYSQAYIGRTKNLKFRVQSHWSKQKEFDRLIFGSKENSILSIDSFRAYDTTKIYLYLTDDLNGLEDEFINLFDNKYLLNRTSGGTLTGLSEAVLNAKTRDLSNQEVIISRITRKQSGQDDKFLGNLFKKANRFFKSKTD